MSDIFETFFGESFRDKRHRQHLELLNQKWAGMTRVRCPKCGQFFGIETALADEFRAGSKNVYCPSGHLLRAKK